MWDRHLYFLCSWNMTFVYLRPIERAKGWPILSILSMSNIFFLILIHDFFNFQPDPGNERLVSSSLNSYVLHKKRCSVIFLVPNQQHIFLKYLFFRNSSRQVFMLSKSHKIENFYIESFDFTYPSTLTQSRKLISRERFIISNF